MAMGWLVKKDSKLADSSNTVDTAAKRADGPATIPLTSMQLGMLYDSLSTDKPGTNIEQLVCHFDDEVPDTSRMAEVWTRLTGRHPTLRCVCNWHDAAGPHLRCLDHVEIHLTVDSFPGLAVQDRAQRLERWLKQDRALGLEIEAPPAWRLGILVWGERSFSLVWTFHHLFLDGPSFSALFQEALLDYSGHISEKRTTPGDLRVPTQADHAQAIEHWRSDPEAAEAASRYFRQMFDGVSIPAGEGWSDILPRPDSTTLKKADTQSGRMEIHTIHVSASTLRQLEALSRETKTTLNTVVQSAWGLVLSRWSGRSDVVFGVVRSGRHLLPGADQTIGCLINTVPVRVSVRRDLSLQQLLIGMRDTMLGLRTCEHATLSDVRSWCDLDANTDLMNCTVLFEPKPLHRRLEHVLSSRMSVELHEQGSSELSLLAYVDDGIDLRLEFDPDRIASSTAKHILSSVGRALNSMALSSPQRVLAALGSLDNNEIAELARWGTPEYPVETSLVCVVTRFEQQVRATPNARAISFAADNRWISFEQLDQAASRLAGWLMARGVKPGVHIALCLPRGIEFVTAMLAVMKSGAAWVPVDPGYPKELMNHMVSDSQAKMLITDRSSRPDLDAVDIVLLEDIENQPDLSVTEALASSWPVDRPAYVIYTSGSTGVPKGVVISHLALACHAQSVIQSYALNPSDRILQFASLSFDVSIEEIVPTLVAGAELVLRHNEAAESVSAFLQLVHDHKLTVLNLPTSFWHTCVEQMGLSGSVLPESVRLLIVGGEKASPGILEQWRRTHPSLHWINAYGPTETTISCTFYELPRNGPLPNGSDVPIGRPLGHARAVVLAIDGSLAPPGAQGELCIAGPGLSSGYLGLESANAERFTSVEGSLDPLLLQWGWNRLYRTGDDARWDPLGQLRFLGRRDRQVKVRGFRVELRTVEHAVEQIAGVAECVVRVERPGEPQARLLAWVLPRPGAQLTEAGLDAALVVSLPLHMRPAIKLVTSWPKTPGGKIDVHRLPVHGPKVDPTAPLQAQSKEVIRMAALFAQVLKRESVGPNDSFFDLGGHSLMAVSLIATVERELGQRVSVSTLKACPTPAGLHAALTKGDDQSGPQFLVVIQPGDQTALPIYGVHSIGHRERFYRPLSRRLGLAQPLFGLTTGYTHLHEQDLSVEQLGKLYFEDIQKHRPQGPLVLAAVSMCAYVAYELAKQLTTAGREVAYLVLFDSEGPDGRPSLQSKAQVLALHWRQLRKKGPRYLLDRLITRLTESGGIRSRMGLMLGQRMGLTRSQSFDHPADHAFVENLAQAVSRYTPGQYRGNIVIFYPQDEPFFDLDEAARTGLGWRSCTTGSIDLTPVPGNHISMLDEPHVGVMAHKLSQLISDWKSSEIDRTS